VARHLVTKHGAKNLVLVSRRGLEAEGAIELKKELEEEGTKVEIVSCDTSNYTSLKKVINNLPESKPLKGVIHCSGVLDDGIVLEQNDEKLEKVMSSKIDGAWNLHLLTKDKNLDFFVMFSSLSGVIGGIGQSNYAAANTFLDALASYRRQQGLSGQSLAWGFWQQVGIGMTAHLSEVDLIRMQRQGVYPLVEKQGLQLFELALNKPDVLLIPANLNFKNKTMDTIPAILRELLRERNLRKANNNQQVNTSVLLEKLISMTENEQIELTLSIVCLEIATILALPNIDTLPTDKPIKELGLDSLMSVELRNRLSVKFTLELPSTLVFDYPTAKDISRYICSKIPNSNNTKTIDLLETNILEDIFRNVTVEKLRKAGLLESLLTLSGMSNKITISTDNQEEDILENNYLDDDFLIARALGE
jgi:type I polyketide synthase PikAII